MSRLVTYFLRGLVVVAPLGITVWVCVWIFTTVNDLLDVSEWGQFNIPGAGFVVVFALLTLIGFLASSIVTRSLLAALDRVFEKLPFVRLLYASTKDMLNAFVGEKRRFDKPVLMSMTPDGAVKLIGFLTAESLSALGAADFVTVYVPQSYGFAGQLLVVPATRIQRIEADATSVMAYIVSGGVTEVDARNQ